MEDISNWQTANAKDANAKSLESLSKAVTQYRSWLEELEAAEDKMRQGAERKRQQGLSSARQELRDLQRRQGKISSRLDKAALRSKEELADSWPSARMQQNSNLNAAKRLEAKLRGLSPTASQRMKLAIQSMGKTTETGNQNNFEQAESYSDIAGRLLRQTEKDTRRSQRRQRQRGRRRRVTGDNYYGQSVVGGDVEIRHEYQVDKRYREDILNEVRGSDVEQEDRALLDNYLRRVVR